jgi:PKD repeat protein
MKKNINYLFGILLIAVAGTSCQKDVGESSLKPVFSYVADGFKVNFTNFSTGAKEYLWDFGDGSADSSKLRSPQHIFTKKGDFLVSLTVKDGLETKTFKDSVSIIGPNVKIDGDFSDWQYVEYAHVNSETFGGSILGVKAFASASDINFYIEGTPDMKLDMFDMYIDTDNNPATGYRVADYPAGSGMDYLLEGPGTTPSSGAVYQHSGAPSAWSFSEVFTFKELNFSKVKPANGKNVVEFSIKKSALGSLGKAINFAFVELNTGWSPIGRTPEHKTSTSKFINIEL